MNICVYGSSSTHTPAKYLDEARKLGQLLADGGHLCINGAGKVSYAYFLHACVCADCLYHLKALQLQPDFCYNLTFCRMAAWAR
jgi:hypothetical protein